MSSYPRALEITQLLNDADITATTDPRAATPPCVLVPPPERDYVNNATMCAYAARWALVAMVPGPGNAEAHAQLDAMVDAVVNVLPVERAVLTAYVLSPDSAPLPAYRIEFVEGV